MVKAYLAIFYIIGLAVVCKIMDRAKRAPKPEALICTRLAPHICKVNGPCNGYPKENK